MTLKTIRTLVLGLATFLVAGAFMHVRATTFNYTGGPQTYTVPAGITSLIVNVWGAGGGGGTFAYDQNTADGGGGAFVTGTLSVIPGEVLTMLVGGGGSADGGETYGGGGAGSGDTASGGGLSAIIVSGSDVVIAGGGGGGGYFFGNAGAGGLSAGSNGSDNGSGEGGTQSSGGAGGAGVDGDGSDGGSLAGGNSGFLGGGGGGGYFGGGGGIYYNDSPEAGGGGGGGSSFLDNLSGSGSSGAGSGRTPGGTSSPYYVAGVGEGGQDSYDFGGYSGGNGQILIIAVNLGPVIVLNGSATVTVVQGQTYTDPGATVTDDADGTTDTIVTTGTVDTSVAGIYTLYYNATDSLGYVGTQVTRTVTVAPGAPTVTTNAATQLSLFGATLNATASAGGQPATITFEYSSSDPTLATGVTTVSVQTLTGTAEGVALSQAVTGLAPATGYYYEVTGSSSLGVTNGNILSFTTVAYTPPVISLNGFASVDVSMGQPYTDPGATATDQKDGTDPVVTSGTVNTAVAGNYTLYYNATDSANNVATQITRTVTVESLPPAGFLDPTLGPGGAGTTTSPIGGSLGGGNTEGKGQSVAVQSDGKIVVAGWAYDSNYNEDFALTRYTADGALDPTFGNGGTVLTPIGGVNGNGNTFAQGQSVALQSNGEIVVAGWAYDSNGDQDFAVARYTTSGALDASFGAGGTVMTPAGSGGGANSVALQSDGDIIVAGFASDGNGNQDFAVTRYTASGALDTTFGAGGTVVTQIGGMTGNGNTIAQGQGVAVQSDGEIVVAGWACYSNGSPDFALARYTTSGALDGTFGAGGTVITALGSGSAEGYGIVLQGDGKIVVAGWAEDSNNYNQDFALARYTASGVLDTNFGSGGTVVTPGGVSNAEGASVALMGDGDIVVAGYGSTYNMFVRGNAQGFAIACYTPEGTLDPSFYFGSPVVTPFPFVVVPSEFLYSSNAAATGIAVDGNGNIVLAGWAQTSAGDTFDFALARYVGVSAAAPTVATNPATQVTAIGASLNATVNANGEPTTVTFQYSSTDPTLASGVTILSAQTLPGAAGGPVSQAVTGLAPSTTYYYSVTGSSTLGVTSGSILSFTTPAYSPPVANEVMAPITTRSPIAIPVLAHCSDIYNFPLTITAVSRASLGAVAITGTTITYTPLINFANFSGRDTFSYTIGDGKGDFATANVVVYNPFYDIKGTYDGVVSWASGADAPNDYGHLSVSLAGLGTFTGKLSLDGATYSLKGTFGNNGSYTVTIPAKGNIAAFTLTLSLDTTGGTNTITGSVSIGSTTYAIDASRVLFNATTDPAPYAGQYTLLIAAPSAPVGPAATGTVAVASGQISSVSIITSGSGYLTAPVVRFSGTSGSGAVASAIVSDGTVSSIVVTKSGTEYPASGETVTIDPPANGLPQGTGYAAMTVTAAGAVTVNGKLGDGTAFSAGAVALGNGTFALYAPLYTAPAGSIYGTVTFEAINGISDCDGTLTWVKPARTSGAYYQSGFTASVQMIGSYYSPPASGRTALQFSAIPGVAAFSLSGGNLHAPIDHTLSISAVTTRNLVRVSHPTADTLAVTITPSRGLFGGTFLANPLKPTARTTIGGVLFQKQNLGEGVFLGTDQAGQATLTPH